MPDYGDSQEHEHGYEPEHEHQDIPAGIEALGMMLSRLSQAGMTEEPAEPVTAEKLMSFYNVLTIKYDFKPGDIVEWKPGFRNATLPGDTDKAVVIEVLDEPIRHIGKSDPGKASFRSYVDIVLGVIDKDDDFIMFHFDSRRLRLVRGGTEKGNQ
jgi:hypothetical protein